MSIILRAFYLSLFSIVVCQPLSAADIFLSPNGNDANNGSIDAPLQQLATAINKAVAGDEILLLEGTYALTKPVVIKTNGQQRRPIMIRPYNQANVIIDASDMQVTQGKTPFAIIIEGSHLHLRELTLQNSSGGGILVRDSEHVTISSNTITASTLAAIKVGTGSRPSRNIELFGNNISQIKTSAAAAMMIADAENVSASNNMISDNDTKGLFVKNSNDVSIEGNKISNNQYANILLHATNDAELTDNEIFSDNAESYGIVVGEKNAATPHSLSNVYIINNVIYNMRGAIIFNDKTLSSVASNTLWNSGAPLLHIAPLKTGTHDIRFTQNLLKNTNAPYVNSNALLNNVRFDNNCWDDAVSIPSQATANGNRSGSIELRNPTASVTQTRNIMSDDNMCRELEAGAREFMSLKLQEDYVAPATEEKAPVMQPMQNEEEATPEMADMDEMSPVQPAQNVPAPMPAQTEPEMQPANSFMEDMRMMIVNLVRNIVEAILQAIFGIAAEPPAVTEAESTTGKMNPSTPLTAPVSTSTPPGMDNMTGGKRTSAPASQPERSNSGNTSRPATVPTGSNAPKTTNNGATPSGAGASSGNSKPATTGTPATATPTTPSPVTAPATPPRNNVDITPIPVLDDMLDADMVNYCTRLLSKFGFGVTPSLYQEYCAQTDIPALKAAIMAQATSGAALPSTLRGLPNTRAYIAEYERLRGFPRVEGETPRHIKYSNDVMRQEVAHRVQANATAQNQFAERMAHFWSNHFSMSRSKNDRVRMLIGAAEREAIRANMYGNFADMLVAVAKHPSMIIYLDNDRSIGENSVIGKRNKNRGINENLAREILELHTLGVDGGYVQRDVEELAKVISGWTWSADRGGFYINVEGHEPGVKTVLGRTFFTQDSNDENYLRQQGEAVLRHIASQPSTARFLATKIVQHYITDTPTDAMVNSLANAYLQSNGNLTAMYEALVNLPESFNGVFSKYPMPYDIMMGTYRLHNAGVKGGLNNRETGQKLMNAMNRMSEYSLWDWTTPDGWPDDAGYWKTPQQVIRTIEWCPYFISNDIDKDVAPETIVTQNFGSQAGAPYLTMMANDGMRDREKRAALCALQIMRNR